MCGVPNNSSRDIALSAEVGAPAGRSGMMKISVDPGYPLYQRTGGPIPGCSCSMHPTICLAGPETMYLGDGIEGVGGIAGGDPPAQTPSGGQKLAGFRGSGPDLFSH